MTDSAASGVLPAPPPEPPRCSDVSQLAPGFQWRLGLTLKDANARLQKAGVPYRFGVFETTRSDERQQWLFGSGRTYRGAWLTNVQSAEYGWHFFGEAADCVPRPLHADGSLGDFTWDVPQSVWQTLFDAATANGCTTGLHWRSEDEDHVQPSGVRTSPSALSRQLYASRGLEAVWEATGMLKGKETA